MLLIPLPALVGFYIGWMVRGGFNEPFQRFLPLIGGTLGFILGNLLIFWIVKRVASTEAVKNK